VSLGEFLSRPVRIDTILWDVASGSFTRSYDPWLDFLNDPHVKRRIEGYRLLQGKLHVRIQINGNPFLYGLAVAAYHPYDWYDDLAESPAAEMVKARLSMLPKIFIDPTTSTGGDLVLPFFNPDNWIDLVGGTAYKMGTLHVRSYNNLQHANAAVGKAEIGIYCWMSDVKLAAPTAGQYGDYDLQSGDEYGTGIVSKTASAVARSAGFLSRIPEIAPYARATEIAAGTIGRVAHLFGYSRPTIVTNISRCKVVSTGALANTDAHEAVDKLTLDSKQELSVDPRTVGLGPTDEMTIAGIAQREMYVGTFNWSEAQTEGTILRNINIDPVMHVIDTSISPHGYKISPMTTVALPFEYWRGTIKVRLQVVASQMHRGRLKLAYDPFKHDYVTTASFNQIYTQIVDLSGNRDFCFEVGWNSHRSWLQVDNETLYTTEMNHVAGPFNPNFSNGQLQVSVLNPLVSPDPTLANSVSINIYVSAGEDFEVASPTDDQLDKAVYYPQSGEYEAQSEEIIAETANVPESPPSLAPIGDSTDDEYTTQVYFGESIRSIRALLKRYCYHSSNRAINNRTFWTDFNFPYHGGSRISNRHQTSTGTPYTYAGMTYLNWFTPCYAAWRGGLRSKYISTSENTVLAVKRNGPRSVSELATSGHALPGPTSHPGDTLGLFNSCASGANVTLTDTGGALEVEFPFSCYKRFAPARASSPGLVDEEVRLGHADTHLLIGMRQVYDFSVLRFAAAGDDFSLFFWIGQPMLAFGPRPPASAILLPIQ
jgi:hypothetical protein